MIHGWKCEHSSSHCVSVLELNLIATWGDMYYLGLTGLQLLGAQGAVIDITYDMLQVYLVLLTVITLFRFSKGELLDGLHFCN